MRADGEHKHAGQRQASSGKRAHRRRGRGERAVLMGAGGRATPTVIGWMGGIDGERVG